MPHDGKSRGRERWLWRLVCQGGHTLAAFICHNLGNRLECELELAGSAFLILRNKDSFLEFFLGIWLLHNLSTDFFKANVHGTLKWVVLHLKYCLRILTHNFNSRAWEAEAEGFPWDEGQPVLLKACLRRQAARAGKGAWRAECFEWKWPPFARGEGHY